MTKALSLDLRERVIARIDGGVFAPPRGGAVRAASVSSAIRRHALVRRTGNAIPARRPAVAHLVNVHLLRYWCRTSACQEFRVWAGIMGKKEPEYASTQRACDPERDSRPAAGGRRCQRGI